MSGTDQVQRRICRGETTDIEDAAKAPHRFSVHLRNEARLVGQWETDVAVREYDDREAYERAQVSMANWKYPLVAG